MADVLYVEHRNDPKTLCTILNERGIDYELVCVETGDILIPVSEDETLALFNERYKKRLGEYRVVMLHLGSGFRPIDFLSKFPKLYLAWISDLANEKVQERDGRLLICDQRSSKLVEFIYEALS